jgi:hypothetical protein
MNHCACCCKPLAAQRERPHPQGYCDAVCLGAHQALKADALKVWRDLCNKLELSPVRTVK